MRSSTRRGTRAHVSGSYIVGPRWAWAKTFYPERLTKTDLAYLAGLFDGEGCIMRRRYGRRVYYHIQITNTYEPVMDWLQSYGGRVQARRPDLNERWKPKFDWCISRKLDVYAFLLCVLPYLKIKRQQALEALEGIRRHEAGRRA